jgi:uncharacterized membrane protein YcgQ (UPF0703/DUF1980 family)
MKRYIRSAAVLVSILLFSACTRQETATNNSKMVQSQENEQTITDNTDSEDISAALQGVDENDTQTSASSSVDLSQIDTIETEKKPHSSLNYNCDIEKDRESFDENNIDIVVGDDYYSTQINDWYMNFEEYEGKTVEIEGYYIADYLPYLFVGRYGPTCPYCQGAYVCFEFYTKEDLTELVSGQDWIKVKGILKEDEDQSGQFYYIETMSIEKMDEVGLGTVEN